MKTRVELGENSYDIIIERGAIEKFASYTGIKGKVLVITDNGVPQEYSQKIAAQSDSAFIYTVPQGEGSKSLETFGKILSFMLSKGFTRKDSVVACGGGVVGDLSGFVSACYMRGIAFYNFPTTVLSQVDSSVGGKTAVNLDGIKNPVGAFHQPKMVIIDPDVLKTLPDRQISNGLAESVKMSLTSDAELFEQFENGDIFEDIDNILFRSVEIKRKVVELDEKEQGLRMILNFGHTLGHGIESEKELDGLYHGECIAMGMLPMCSDEVRERLVPVLEKLNLKTETDFSVDRAISAVLHDKKAGAGEINTVFVEKVGNCEIRKMNADELKEKLYLIKEGQR